MNGSPGRVHYRKMFDAIRVGLNVATLYLSVVVNTEQLFGQGLKAFIGRRKSLFYLVKHGVGGRYG